MRRPLTIRMCLLAAIVIPALTVLGVGTDTETQAQGYRLEKYWKCSRCGGYLGNGVSRPTTCYHCDAKRQQAARNPSKNNPQVAPILVGVGIVAVGALALFCLNRPGSSNPPRRY
jgi:hypothetical protein